MQITWLDCYVIQERIVYLWWNHYISVKNLWIKCVFCVIQMINKILHSWIYWNCWGELTKCSAKPHILSFFPTRLMNSVPEHSCKIFYKPKNFKNNQDRWAATWQNLQSDCVPSKDSDQPGHPPSLIRVFAVRMKKPWFLSYPLSAQRRLWSDWADLWSDWADLSLRWAQCLFVGFIMLWLKYVFIYWQYSCETSTVCSEACWNVLLYTNISSASTRKINSPSEPPQNQQNGLCAQQRLRSAWASA